MEDKTFEQAMEELADLVQQLEEGKLSLDDSLLAYERGVALSRQIDKMLSNAEQRVQVLLANGEIAPFETEAEGAQ